jgi:Na+-driven multidrug efflux pump
MTGTKEDRSYIKKLLLIAVPMMIQNGISNFVNLLDNLMIGRVGTNALSGVAIANQLIFVFYLVIFGATAGVGIFTAQFKGNDDTEGIRYTFRFKIVFNTILSAICTVILLIWAPNLINLFLLGDGNPADAAETLQIGVDYMHVILISLIPIGITQAYAGTLRDLGSTKVPMFASLAAILVNLAGNWLLIYGHFGLPVLDLGVDSKHHLFCNERHLGHHFLGLELDQFHRQQHRQRHQQHGHDHMGNHQNLGFHDR